MGPGTDHRGALWGDSAFFNRGNDPFSIAVATEADPNWMMAEGANLDTSLVDMAALASPAKARSRAPVTN